MKFVRHNERSAIRRALPLACWAFRKSDLCLVARRALDLSPDGMLLLSDRALAQGEPLYITFRATDLGIWFDAEAEVSRLIHGRRPKDKGRAVGVCFTHFDPIKRFILRGQIRHVPPPIPTRPQRIDYAASVARLITVPDQLDIVEVAA